MAADTPPSPKFIFFDCDDTLYRNDWKTGDRLTRKIAQYTESELGVDGAKAYELYKTHGTCLKGLLAEGLLPRDRIEEYLAAVHDVSLEEIDEDPAMRAIVEACRTKADRFVFTASISEHAKRCLERVGVDDLFTCIIDTRTCDLETKHSPEAFEKAMRAAGASDPLACMLIDDSVKNIRTAKSLGWTTVLIGKHERDTGAPFTCPEADFHLDDVYDLPAALPHLFPSLKPPYPRP
jgi:pyrimidine 5'-nucleotidase